MTALPHAGRLCAAEAVTAPRSRRRHMRRRLWAMFVMTGVGVCGAGLVVGVCLAIPS